MTREEIKEICITRWLWISTSSKRKYYKELGYTIYKDYKGKRYTVVHPWDLPERSTYRFLAKCPPFK